MRVQRALSTLAAVVPVRYQVSLPNDVVVESAGDNLSALLLPAVYLCVEPVVWSPSHARARCVGTDRCPECLRGAAHNVGPKE